MFDQLLMQIINATVPVPTPTLLDQITTTATSAAALISVVVGIITYAITQFRKVRKEELTKRDKWILESMKAAQITAQKSAENIGQSKGVIQAIYEMNLPEADRKKIEEAVMPALRETDQRLAAANQQAAMIKAKAVEIFGEAGDVDNDTTVPREDAAISLKLRGTI
jgi:broad specificity polyphosphatase/5'/3'-nucleotidase SurE